MSRRPNGEDRFDGDIRLEIYYFEIPDLLIYDANIHVTALSPTKLYLPC